MKVAKIFPHSTNQQKLFIWNRYLNFLQQWINLYNGLFISNRSQMKCPLTPWNKTGTLPSQCKDWPFVMVIGVISWPEQKFDINNLHMTSNWYNTWTGVEYGPHNSCTLSMLIKIVNIYLCQCDWLFNIFEYIKYFMYNLCIVSNKL